MIWPSIFTTLKFILVALVLMLWVSKMTIIVVYKSQTKDSLASRFLGWYNNFEIYGSGNHKKVKALSAANKLTTAFWLLFSFFVLFLFLGNRFILS